jgi:hypothetical protein
VGALAEPGGQGSAAAGQTGLDRAGRDGQGRGHLLNGHAEEVMQDDHLPV